MIGASVAKIINATQARLNLNTLIDETVQNHEPIIITGKRNNVIMLAQEDWNAIQEMLNQTITNQPFSDTSQLKGNSLKFL